MQLPTEGKNKAEGASGHSQPGHPAAKQNPLCRQPGRTVIPHSMQDTDRASIFEGRGFWKDIMKRDHTRYNAKQAGDKLRTAVGVSLWMALEAGFRLPRVG